MLREHWEKMIRSYAMDAIFAKKGNVQKYKIKNLLHTIGTTDQISVANPGLGQLIELTSPEGDGSALVNNRKLIHMNFFPSHGTTKRIPAPAR